MVPTIQTYDTHGTYLAKLFV